MDRTVKSKTILILFLALLLPLLFGIETFAEEKSFSETVFPTGEHTYSCLYKDTRRQFSEYAPEGEIKGILLMLHGYGSSGEDFRLLTKMDIQANERGYTVVYPTGMASPEDKTSAAGWNSGIGDSSADDIGFLRALAKYMQGKYGLSRSETYAAGFSNGGFMVYRIALEGQNEFAGVAGVAAMMPKKMWDMRPEELKMSLLQVNGTKDEAVPMRLNGTDRYANAPAIEDVIAYYAAANRLTAKNTEEISTRATLTVYHAEDRTEQVWQVLIQDGRHSWPEGKYSGFDVNTLILDFFDGV